MDAIGNAVFENALIGFWEWQIPENAVQLSEAFKKVLGYNPGELSNTPSTFQKLIFAEDLEPLLTN